MPALDTVINIRYESENSPGDDQEFPSSLRDRLLGFTYTDKTRGADEVKLSFDNGDLSLFDDPRFRIGTKLHLQWGFPWRIGPVREVTIDEIEGFRELQVKGASSRMLGAISLQRTRVFEGVTASDVAETIAREMGFTSSDSRQIEAPEIEIRYESISQTAETDLAFLTRLAGDEDFIFRISGNVFHFHPPSEGAAATLTLTYFDDQVGWFVSEPKIKQKSTGRSGRSTRRGRNPREREQVEGTESNTTDTTRNNLGEQIIFRDPASGEYRQKTQETTPDPRGQDDKAATSAESDEEAQRNARRASRQSARGSVEIECEIVGDAQMSADTVVRIEGIGSKHSGNYLITELVHNVKTGFTCTVKGKRNAVSRSSSGSAASRAGRQRTEQQLAMEIAMLAGNLATGAITQEQHDTRLAALTAQLERAINGSGEEVAGKVNNAEGPNERELERVTIRDPVTGRYRETYRRRGASSSGASGNQTQSGGTR